MTTAWIVGRSGMLGGAIARRIARTPGWSENVTDPLPWLDGADAVRAAAREGVERLIAASGDGPSAVIWVGGAAVTSSSDAQVDAEFELLVAAFGGMSDGWRGREHRTLVFLASSAGGVYAGSGEPPFTESTAPAPISPYGRLKLRSEEHARSVLGKLGIPLYIGRIANLYGPGQRLSKMQGIVSHLALARLTPTPASVYVPLDTLRDYLYVDDAARLVLDGLDRLAREGGQVTKVLASGKGTTIAELLGQLRLISKARPRVILGSSPTARHQAKDLRLRSEVWPELDRVDATTLPDGIAQTIRDVERQLLARDQPTAGSSAR